MVDYGKLVLEVVKTNAEYRHGSDDENRSHHEEIDAELMRAQSAILGKESEPLDVSPYIQKTMTTIFELPEEKK